MASIKFHPAIGLLCGLVLFGMIQQSEAVCTALCVKGTYITCNSTGKEHLYGCMCSCAPQGAYGCIVHTANGKTISCES
ncbi:hypothetical protein LUZ62_029925 [Rhynchospora pubera]|uniref:Uncharacterized protein n=1 Tax=Rhynchospora pubera TaxID=906938 RepID=A0AAV8DDQ0_9POAL|nr:hypothetical protein LUZ62_075030 [Rhynchospora pubera]KAJ4817359.1 hypothetical protein LUZ62_029925 [Rhynchospora pubera]